MTTSKIEKELMDILKLKSKKGEKRPDTLARVLKAVTDLSDEAFDELPKEASDWANKASKLLDKQEAIPEFPDRETEDGDGAEETDVTKTNAKAAKAAKEPKAEKAPKAEKVKAAPKEAKKKVARGDGIGAAVLNHVLKNPKDGPEDIVAALKAKGLEASANTTGGMRSSFIRDIRFLASKGLLTKDILGEG